MTAGRYELTGATVYLQINMMRASSIGLCRAWSTPVRGVVKAEDKWKGPG